MSGELVLVTGPPGAGKSNVATALASQWTPSALVQGDAFFGFLRAGRIDPWLPESDSQNSVVTDAAGYATGRFVAGGYWTVYDGIIGPWYLPQFLAATGLRRVHYVILLPEVEVCVERVATRVGHGFTDESATRHMHAQFEQSQVDHRHVIRGTSASVGSLAESIVERVGAGGLAFDR